MAPQAGSNQATQTSSDSSRFLRRYKDGYRVAKVINFYGQLVKVLGVLVGMVVLGVEIVLLTQNPSLNQNAVGLIVLATLVATIIIVLFWIIGVVIAARGQVLKASLDCAVNSSPFLDLNQKVEVMS